VFCLLFCGQVVFAQTGGTPGQLPSASSTPQKDTNANKSNTNKWKNIDPVLTYQKLNSAHIYTSDSALHTFQRSPFTEPWYQDLGNQGSPVNNLLFTPEDRLGPTLGYHVFDVYRFNIDSLPYYNTTRPFSIFSYRLGSKLEQTAWISHTQSIRPNWNFAVEYHKTYSPGLYQTERNNHDNGFLTTNYKSLDRHYALFGAMVYNKEQHDENGGIDSAGLLLNSNYIDRSTIPTAYGNEYYSATRSPVSNVLRDFSMLVQQSYTWGLTDTTYNADSTQFSYKLIPRFSITHKLELSTEKHTYKDVSPDSTRYSTLFNESFVNTGSNYYYAPVDSVVTEQVWFWIDNKISLDGYLGKEGHQLKFSAGIGDRYDEFISKPITDSGGQVHTGILSNYLEGELKKEALQPGQWEYGANAKFFFTGQDAGDFLLHLLLGKEFKNASFVAGFKEQLNSAPYSYTNYQNEYAHLTYNLNKESVSQVYATLASAALRLSGGVRSYVISNYIYIDQNETPSQYTVPFTLNQAWIRKVFKLGDFYLDNEFVYQQEAINTPINVPAFMGKNQISYEHSLFHHTLKTAVGFAVQYNTAYHPAGYDALLNRFFYQNTTYIGNPPVMSLYVNFRVKRFRAFIMGDQLQQLFYLRNTILFTGTPQVSFSGISGYNPIPVYAAPDALIRFGFSWALVD